MSEIAEFATNYSVEKEDQIAFSWNGEHGDRFVDRNHAFRKRVLEWVIENPASAPLPLVRDLFLAETRYSKEAWGIDIRVSKLADVLLNRGGPDYVEAYLEGRFQGFDASMAAGNVQLPAPLVASFLREVDRRLGLPNIGERRRRLLTAGKDLFARWAHASR